MKLSISNYGLTAIKRAIETKFPPAQFHNVDVSNESIKAALVDCINAMTEQELTDLVDFALDFGN